MPLTRRTALKLGLAAGAAGFLGRGLRGAEGAAADAYERTFRYLETLRRDDGGYGWAERGISHLTPTLAAIRCYALFERAPPRKAELVAWVRRGHPREIKKLEQERRTFDFQQLLALWLLGASAPEIEARLRAITRPTAYLKQYERSGYPLLPSEAGVVMAYVRQGLSLDAIREPFGAYFEARQRPNGSFNNTPATEGGDGHVGNTYWASLALLLLGRARQLQPELAVWLRACQLPGGGFTYAPRPEFGGVDDIAYTWYALAGLELLEAPGPDRPEACVAQIHTLANSDGGFGDRAGWLSNAMATWHALSALKMLEALPSLGRLVRPAPRARRALPAGLKVCTIQVEAHGQGSPADAVELARSLKIDLWAAKNAKPEWRAQAQALAEARSVPVRFVVGNEEYGTWVNVPGMGTYSHISDLVAPGDTDIGPSLSGAGAVSWPEFRRRRLEPLQRGQGRLVWQFGENEELVRMLLDDSVERGGFAAISTFHFGNPDFMNTEPFLQRWRGRIPFIALQDAHGPEPWWFGDQLTGFRTLFLAEEPTWAGWLRALENNWTVAVRRDQWTQGRTWLHSGRDEVRDFVLAREREWRWWDHGGVARPMVSLAVLRPADVFEVGRPGRGVVVRVRCAWENTAQGLPKNPLAELVRLNVDRRGVAPELVTRKRANGQLEDHHHRWAIPDVAPGRHEATAIVRVRSSGAEAVQTVHWTAA